MIRPQTSRRFQLTGLPHVLDSQVSLRIIIAIALGLSVVTAITSSIVLFTTGQTGAGVIFVLIGVAQVVLFALYFHYHVVATRAEAVHFAEVERHLLAIERGLGPRLD